MREWSADHPKAKLMARKRAAILDAARTAFLQVGYEGTSMESIAAAAGVSIMTLYRHAASKEDLFAAVIVGACDYSDEARQVETAGLMQQTLEDALIYVGLSFQNKLYDPDTIGLLRTVMAESTRFPVLAETAYNGFIKTYEDNLNSFVAQRPDGGDVAAGVRRELCSQFFADLIGKDMLRALLGLGAASPGKRRQRARDAAREMLAALAASPERRAVADR